MGAWIVSQSAATFLLSAALATYVALQRPRTGLHGAVLVLLAAFMAWTAGLVILHGRPGEPAAARIATLTVFAGVMLAVPLWLFLCARVARVALVSERPQAALWALLVPAFLDFAALASDDLHGLFASRRAEEIVLAADTSWAGPLFWVHCGWAYASVVGGILLCVRCALRSADPTQRKQLLLVACGAGVPSVSTGILMLGWLPPGVQLTPADLGVSAVCLVVAIARYRFLEPSPVPAHAVISHLRDALVLADAAGVVVDANPAAELLLRERLGALRGRPLEAILQRIDPQGDLAHDWIHGEGESHGERTLVTPDERVLDVSSARVAGGDGRVAGSFLVVRDRTQQVRRERRRHQSQRLESLGVIAAGIAHEINNPLAFVRTNLAHLAQLVDTAEKGAAEAPSAQTKQGAEMGEILGETQAGVDRISRIVDATRKLSREARDERDEVDLNAVATGALELAELSRGVPAETELCAELPTVWGSGEQLVQVVLNLLINAKQAVGRGPAGRIRLSTRAGKEAVELRVDDSGPGVAPEARERIFDPFYTTKAPDEGTGLGLAIAFEIATRHGGSLAVDASDLGGARFRLRLPRYR